MVSHPDSTSVSAKAARSLTLAVQDGAYASHTAAMAALSRFIKRSCIPHPSMILGVGLSGLILHWRLFEAISRAERRSMTKALLNACAKFGFRAERGDGRLPAGAMIGVSFKFEPQHPTNNDLLHPDSGRAETATDDNLRWRAA